MSTQHTPTRQTNCYCGGVIVEVLTKDKRTPYGWIRNHYKKPRWQTDNCFPADHKKVTNG